MDIDQTKQEVRERVWTLLDDHGAVIPPGAHGHIPSFDGAQAAADRLARLDAWRRATVIKANPDKAQLPVRVHALTGGKTVYMAVPKLAAAAPFYLLDPNKLAGPPEQEAASKTTSAPKVAVADLRPVDFVVCGSVAVNRNGVRLGKGAGYSDIEVALLIEAGLLTPDAIIATTVHPLQVLDEELPEATHDFSVDLIVTPDETIVCQPPRRPPGILWASLSPDKIAAIPALAARAPRP